MDLQSNSEGFRGVRWQLADALSFLRQACSSEDEIKARWPVVQALLNPAAEPMAALSDLWGGPPPPVLRNRLRHHFLSAVNQRLQALYRAHLKAQAEPLPGSHEAMLTRLSGTEEDARTIVASYDWDWLATFLGDETSASLLWCLSNFAFEIRRVNFRFTRHCNIACRHCYNESGPSQKPNRLARDTMLSIIAQMSKAGLNNLNLTGGEPFLYLDDVTALLGAAREAGVATLSVYTNGYFARSEAAADSILSRLDACGFGIGADDHLKVSTGVFHQEFLSIERIVHLARAYHRAFDRPLRVDWELVSAQAVDEKRSARAQLAAEVIGVPVDLRFRATEPLGRGRNLDLTGRIDDGPCRKIKQLVFEYDGKVVPCCGLNDGNEGIVIGQVQRHDLRELVKRMQNDPILQQIARGTFAELAAHRGMAWAESSLTSKCHACQQVVGDLSSREVMMARMRPHQRFYPFWFEA